MIPDEAVEAVAEAMHDRDAYAELFEDAPEHRRARYLDAARGILEVAAPHLMAEAYDEGFTDCAGEHTKQRNAASHPIARTNPYRSAK